MVGKRGEIDGCLLEMCGCCRGVVGGFLKLFCSQSDLILTRGVFDVSY